MITIEQLLESVDLDFEPRWVTKNALGIVAIRSGGKPKPESPKWIGSTKRYESFGQLKLAEFDGKDWTECIYEVKPKVDPTKWIGTLCRFSNHKDRLDCRINRLAHITPGGNFVTLDDGLAYPYCEPIRPDDELIYQGE